MSDPKLIAFYLPQYHPIPENDAWWGKGFTEWTNVGRARPLFEGHAQPRVPADLGYYDLRLPETRLAQAALARQYGIHGFCYYHYWFNGHRLLERPVNEILASGQPDFPFCLCWANENWTRAWDGLDREVLIRQEYRPEDDLAHIRWLAQAFRDPRYIRIEGKPLFLVYRITNLPDPVQTVSVWREEARKLGVGEIYLATVESRVGGAQALNPSGIGFDAAVEFQPDGLQMPKPIRRIGQYGGVYDYGAMVESMLRKPQPGYQRFDCVTPGWDNTARRKENPTIITGSSPQLYQRWLETVIDRSSKSDAENLVFINAWNEWAEGAYLEPDQASGHAYLEATLRALEQAKSQNAQRSVVPIPSQLETNPSIAPASPSGGARAPRLSVCIPVYNGNNYLEAALRSTLSQTFTDIELIVVDDCSSQDPKPILDQFKDPRLQCHRNPVRLGLVANWNRCLELARGEFVCLFHQDDIMDRDNLSRKMEFLEKHPSAGLVYSDARVVEADLSVRHQRWFTPTEPNRDAMFEGKVFFEKLIAGDNLICCPSVVLRRTCIQELGKFNPQLPYTADWEMWLRIALHHDVGYIAAPLLLYRVHDTNETHRFKGLKELEQSFRAKMLALDRGKELLPDSARLRKQVAHGLAERALEEISRLRGQLSPKVTTSWLTFAAEAHHAGLENPSFQSASEWFLGIFERCGGPFGGEMPEEKWSDAEETQFVQAQQWERNGNLQSALAALEMLAATRPSSIRAWFELARIQLAAGRMDAADNSLSLIIGLEPKDQLKCCEALALRGRARETSGKKTEALEDFTRATQLALMSGHPEIACKIDAWMGAVLQTKRAMPTDSITREELQKYASQSRFAQALGLALGRPGPISTYELERALPVWDDLFTGKFDRSKHSGRIQGWEAIAAAMAKLHLEKARERSDAPTQRQVQQAWGVLHTLAQPGSIPDSLLREMENLPTNSDPDAPEVSIIIPTFNRLDFTRQCLASIQTHPGSTAYEIIVVDNESSDGTVEFLKAEQTARRLRAVFNQQNIGFAKACNLGARAARGQYLVFLNNDTEARPGWLDALAESVRTDGQVAAVGSKLLFPDGTIQHAGVAILEDRKLRDPLVARHIHYHKPSETPEANEPRIYQALTAACLLVRRAAFEKVGGFDEGYWNGYEDVDLCFRLGQDGGTLLYQPASVLMHHESQSGPERFRQVGPNIQRLHEKWLGKIRPDYVVMEEGKIVATDTALIRRYARPDQSLQSAQPVASIIVLAHNQLEHTRRCFESVLAHTTLPFELILVDNASNDGTADCLKALAAQHSNISVIRNETNLGFSKGNNQGLAIARGDCVILLNNDTVVTEHWLDGLLACLQDQPDIGIVGPMTNSAVGPQLVADVSYQSLDQLPQFAAAWSAGHDGKYLEANRVIGFCLMARRAVVERIGGLDERFGSGNFEDDDFCVRARLAGFQVRIAENVYIHHAGSQTFKGAGIDYREAMLNNWALFKTKWAIAPETPPQAGYLTPKILPQKVALKVPLRDLSGSHQPNLNRVWIEKESTGLTDFVPKTAAAPPTTAALPRCAQLARLEEPRGLLRQKNLQAAWQTTVAAMDLRPFHPEAALLLAEIALAAGDASSARVCAQAAARMAPGWKAPKQFTQKTQKGNARPDWLILPEAIGAQNSSSPRLTVCVIAKNEEQFLQQCLDSIKPIAHQIVLVDTGSTDRTVEIAKAGGAEVHQFAWCDDFSAARNAALEQARGDWILILDADEELPPDQHASLQTDIKNPKSMACRMPLVNLQEQTEGVNYVPRLFRNAPGAYYFGRIHEQVFPSLIALSKGWGMLTGLGTAQIRHHGYRDEVLKDRNKIERNLRLLRQAIQETPGDANLVMNFGLELVRSGDLPHGLEQYREAFRLMSAQPDAQVVPELREVLLTQFTCHLYKQHEHAETVRVLNSPLAKNGGLTASLHFALGLSRYELQNYREAADHMRRCIAQRHQAGFSPVNSDILTSAPQHCLALSLAKLEDAAGAEKAFEAALKEKGRTGDCMVDYARFLAEQKRPVDALHRLHEAVALDPHNLKAWLLGGDIALSRPDFLEFALDWTGEACRYLPDNMAILSQRAEALMLGEKTEEATGLWRKACNGVRPPQALAAWILCSAAQDQPIEPTLGVEEEAAASRAFVQTYRRLITFGARHTIERVNAHLHACRESLPTAVQWLESALAEAHNAQPTEAEVVK